MAVRRFKYFFYCQSCWDREKAPVITKEQKNWNNKQKKIAFDVCNLYLNNYIDNFNKLKNLKNKRKIKKLIYNFYENYSTVEPMFAILIHDILKLQGGDPVRELPYEIDFSDLRNIKCADVYDRKFNIVIETKAAYRDTPAQRLLMEQKKSMKEHFKGCKIYGVSPDNKQKGLIGLFRFLYYLDKMVGEL